MYPKYTNVTPFAVCPYGNNYFKNAQSELLYILTPSLTLGHN